MEEDTVIFGDQAVPAAPASTREERLAEYARQFVDLKNEADEINERLKEVKNFIRGELPEEAGEHAIQVNETTTLHVDLPEKWEWDKERMAETFPPGSAPDCVKVNYTVDKRAFEAAEPHVRAVLETMLTIGVGSPRFKVERS